MSGAGMCMQTMVTRLSDPYGECEDPSDVDKNLNAYAEHYPVEYTAHVSIGIIASTSRAATPITSNAMCMCSYLFLRPVQWYTSIMCHIIIL